MQDLVYQGSLVGSRINCQLQGPLIGKIFMILLYEP